MTNQAPHSSDYYNQHKLHALTERVMDRLEDILTYFNVELKFSSKMYYGPCPIHGGDKFNALNIYHTGHSYRGNWKCRTMQCERHFKSSIIGFIRGLLSKQRYDWAGPNDETVTFRETIDFILSFLNEDLNKINVDLSVAEQKRFTQQVIRDNNNRRKPNTGITRSQVRKSLKIPAEYYLNRNYSVNILNSYDIGLCVHRDKPMYNRVVVPVYDTDYKFMVGCTGRSIFEKCDKCGTWHDYNIACPSEDDRWKFCKWKHSANFDGKNTLYNFWKAKGHIAESAIAILVESPGNVWRLEEAGIHNSVGLFGTSLSEGQKTLLDTSGALSLITIMDGDESGKKASQIIHKQCQRMYHMYNIELKTGDIGCMTVNDVKEIVKPILEQANSKVSI